MAVDTVQQPEPCGGPDLHFPTLNRAVPEHNPVKRADDVERDNQDAGTTDIPTASQDAADNQSTMDSSLRGGASETADVSERLLVTSPQNSVPPRITDSRSHVQAHYRQPVELPCAAQGFPLPSYIWFRSHGGSSSPVALGERIRQVGGSLFLRSAHIEDSGRYMCVVNNTVGAERASTSLLVTTPLSAYISPQQQTVDVGRAAQLNCTTEGHPQLAVSWLKDGHPLTTSSRVRLVAPQILRIEHVERSDKGMYQCVVSNNDETAQGTAELRLGDVAPVLVATFAGGTLRPGAAWSAQCEAAGSPLPTLSWQRDGAPLSSDEQRLQVGFCAA
ncbi:Down syndrome cell adhesion molecule-like protein Dscam2 [Schistocerca cancellata]|uniref:Down syndrome cell adhesion molecule-like protein Dscam2 n=1 Tax=Schistocerca cancellata TaxID=274614 RepID=UPI00211970C7|nr:Down syndrome cell adhesion molecule-like protein Dscam2 [Schistocerca cancellata]